MGDRPKPKFLSHLSPRFRASHGNRSTVSLPPPVASPTPLGPPDARPSSVSNLRDATSDAAPTCSGFRKLGSKVRDFVMGRRAKPGAAIPSPATSQASPPPEAPTFIPPEVRPSSPPASLVPIHSGDPSVASNTTDTRPLSPPERAQNAYDHGGHLNSPAVDTIERVSGALDDVDSTAGSYGDIISKISVFSDILTALGEVHPYLKLATSAINGVVTPIIKQVARDEKFQALLEQMSLAYDLVIAEFGAVARRKERPATRQMKLLQKISVESQQCADFIEKEYIGSSWVRVTKNIFKGSKVDETVDCYTSVFSGLRTRWHEEADRSRDARGMLDKLPRVPHAGHTSQKACLDNTRIAVLKEIDDWVGNPDSPRALFVFGVAGSGKSTVAHTVAGGCEDRLQLGSFFAFERDDPSRTPQRLLGTVAYNLAQWDEGYRDELVRMLKDDPKLADSPDIQKQWDRLIVGPAASISSPSRVLVVIDAFDECPESDDNSSQWLLECLTLRASELPPNLRVLVTSRPVPLYQDSEVMTSVGTLDLSKFSAADDIRLYVRSQLLLPKKGLSDSQCDDVAHASDGLFQWAATACRFLREKLAGTTMSAKFTQYLDQLIHGASRSPNTPKGLPSLDTLYDTVLCATFDPNDENAMTNFRYTVATMLCAQTPLPVHVLQSIFEQAIPSRLGVVKSVLGSMGVVLEGVSGPSSPVRPMHLSFREFLLDVARSGTQWHITKAHIAHGHRILALGGLRIMAGDLSFNMHSLPSSMISGDEARRKVHCPHPTLAYTTSNLHHHLGGVHSWGIGGRNLNLFRRAWQRLLYNKLLFWMEWSTIRGELDEIYTVLESAIRMLTGKDRRFVNDAMLFYGLLYPPPNVQPAHVYLSGLAFAPADSLVRQRYMPHFRGIPSVSPHRDSWIEIENPPRATWNSRVAWSSDCRYIREDSLPSRCWDARTGDAVDLPPNLDWRYASLESADGRVKVSLSVVGKELVANVERTLIARPANTTPVRFTIETGTYGDDYRADVSPDGKWLVIVDSAHDLSLWDLGTGLSVRSLSEQATEEIVVAATFSPDSREIVGYGRDEGVHYIFPIHEETGGDDNQTMAWVNVNFKPQPQIDDNGENSPDADLRCTRWDIRVPMVYYDLLRHDLGMRLILGGLRVDYTDAYYGTEWAHCYAGTIEAEETGDEYAEVDAEMVEREVESSGSKGETEEREYEYSSDDFL